MEEEKDKIYHISDKDRPLNEDDVRIIVSQQLRNITAPTVVQAGYMQSGNFVSGSAGWKLSPTGAEFQSVTIGGVVLTTRGSFGGSGTDGALAITTGTTTLDLGGSLTFFKNYTSISITGDGKLAFSNPHANGTVISIKSQGDVTLTSSAAPMLDVVGMGGTSSGVVFIGTGATSGTDSTGAPAGQAGGAAPTMRNDFNVANLSKFFTFFAAGAKGGNGVAGGAGSAGGTGGTGGGVLILECGGTLNFTTANGISVVGADGTAGTSPTSGLALGGTGGSGGGGGTFIGLYNTAGTITGTINVSGGSGGAGGVRFSGTNNQDQSGGPGGGGGASVAGTVGITGTTVSGAGAANVAGSAGGAGFSIAVQNTEFS